MDVSARITNLFRQVMLRTGSVSPYVNLVIRPDIIVIGFIMVGAYLGGRVYLFIGVMGRITQRERITGRFTSRVVAINVVRLGVGKADGRFVARNGRVRRLTLEVLGRVDQVSNLGPIRVTMPYGIVQVRPNVRAIGQDRQQINGLRLGFIPVILDNMLAYCTGLVATVRATRVNPLMSVG